MEKFIYNENRFRLIDITDWHAGHIKTGSYDIAIRGFMERQGDYIYIRLNDLTHYEGIEYKRVVYQFEKNYKECIKYLSKNYKGYKIYNSNSIYNLTYRQRQEILSY